MTQPRQRSQNIFFVMKGHLFVTLQVMFTYCCEPNATHAKSVMSYVNTY